MECWCLFIWVLWLLPHLASGPTALQEAEALVRAHLQQGPDCRLLNFDLTTDGFLRYKTSDSHRKISYYSVRLEKINDLQYLGSTEQGLLQVLCDSGSVIFQTYQDPDGDDDEMLSQVSLPLQQISEEQLNLLTQAVVARQK